MSNSNQSGSNQDKRRALLGELESIRNLLGEDKQHSADLPLLTEASTVPLLAPESDAVSHIPVLSALAENPLDAIRRASAKVAANTIRSRETAEDTPAITAHDRAKIVDDVIKAALPRVELLLRELVQEALLQDKLRGKR